MTMPGNELRILLVEDDVGLRQLMALQLQLLGHHVTEAVNGRQPLELLQEQGKPFDLVVMDVQMPVLDGLETVRCLRSHPSTRSLPVLLMSAANADHGLAAGVDLTIEKPHSRHNLVAAIALTLQIRAELPTGGNN